MNRQHKHESDSSQHRPSSISGNAEAPNIYMNDTEQKISVITVDKVPIILSKLNSNVQKAIVKPIIQTKPVMKGEKDEKKPDNTNVKLKAVYKNVEIKHSKVKLLPLIASTATPSEEKTEESIYYNEVTFVNNPIKLDDLVDCVIQMKIKTDSFKDEYEVNINISMK